MHTVKTLLVSKGSQVWTVPPDASVYDALAVMANKDIGAVVVTDADGKIEGILSERDYARKIVLQGKISKTTRVKDIMTSAPYCVRPNATTDQCMAIMTDKHLRHLPVQENSKLVGLISIGDLVKSVIADQKDLITNLENYISGSAGVP